MSQTLYARVPDAVKEAVDAHAESRGLTLAACVAELLERGLASHEDGPVVARLEARIEKMQRELTQTRLELEQAEMRVDTMREREQGVVNAQRSLAQRMQLIVGQCAKCSGVVRGEDLLVAGVCRNCTAPLTSLLTNRSQGTSGIKQEEFLLVLGAVGVLLGAAVLASKA